MAQSGTVTIESFEGRLRGTLSSVVFANVDPGDGELVGDGCDTRLTGARFDAAVTPGTR